jgi:LuxR family maltose regulon positive regulatory protein
VLADARLCLVRATTLQELGRIDEAGHWLEAAERADSVSTTPAKFSATTAAIAGGRAINDYFAGNAAGIRAAVAPALAHDTDGSDYWKSALLTTLGISTYVEGHDADAAGLLEEAVRMGVASDHALALIHALGWCAIVQYGRGESEQGDRVVEQTESLLQARPGMSAYYGAAMAHLARGAKHEHDGRIPEAESEVARAVELARRGDAKFEMVLGLAAHTRLKGQLGDSAGARTLLGQARQAISECVDPGVLPGLVDAVERELRLAPRRPTQAIYAGDLSERELAVLRLLASDLTQREISSHLYVSFNTVKTHNKSIFQKLGVSTRQEAVRRARELGLL